MSRLPVLSTPGRNATPPISGIPTPMSRRTRSSLGPSALPATTHSPDDAEAMDQLQAALKQRPPSSMKKLLDEAGPGSPDTPTQSGFSSLAPPKGGLQPRTPITRSRTPNLGVSTRAANPVTPSSSRASSRPSVGGRPSLGAAGTITPRRVSMASATTTPYGRRPESRLSVANEAKFAPQVGDKVRMQSMGMEGVLRYLGPTEFRDGVWAGVELEGGFKGMGKNDGSVDGVRYFDCPELCGVFCLASRLSAPTTPSAHPSRPISQASHISSISSRATPAADRRAPPLSGMVTPAKSRSVSSSLRPGFKAEHDPMPSSGSDRPQRTLLGNSTSTNTAGMGNAAAASSAAGKITAGSRASKYLGMTAKQLQSARDGTLGASVRGPPPSVSATTPKASRVSMAVSTPAARGRPSIGGIGVNSFATPRARPRGSLATGTTGAASGAGEAMPPPPSPGKIRTAVASRTAELDAQIRDLTARNAQLEIQLESALSEALAAAQNAGTEVDPDAPDLEALRNEIESTQKEADELRHHLAQSQEDARQATDLAEELLNKEKSYEEEIEHQKREVERVTKELGLEVDRAKSELEAGAEARREEVKGLEGRVKGLEDELGESEGNVEELRAAGQATISLYEQKLTDQETRSYELEDRIRSLEDKLTKSESDRIRIQAQLDDPTRNPPIPAGQSAAEIDNETLQVQVKHLQSKIMGLEEQVEEGRTQLETEADAWKARVEKVRAGEREKSDVIKGLREEIAGLQSQAKGAKTRVGELEGALSEVRAALEGARGEIEGLRGEASEASSLRTALQKASSTEAALADRNKVVEELREKMANYDEMKLDCERFSSQVAALQAELTSLERRSPLLSDNQLPQPSPSRTGAHLPLPPLPAGQTHRKPRLSTGSQEGDEQKMHGYHHVIRELTTENRKLESRIRQVQKELDEAERKMKSMQDDLELSREEVRLLEDIKSPERRRAEAEEEDAAAGGSGKEWREKAEQAAATIRELEKEIAELESLIESKIYYQDDLENRIHELERLLREANGTSRVQQRPPHSRGNTGASRADTTPSRSSSTTGSVHTADEGFDDGDMTFTASSPQSTRVASSGSGPAAALGMGKMRCELCEGPHDLDSCPVFAGNLDALPDRLPSSTASQEGGNVIDLRGSSRRRCADCDSTDHDTADCPLADDVF